MITIGEAVIVMLIMAIIISIISYHSGYNNGYRDGTINELNRRVENYTWSITYETEDKEGEK